MTTASTDLVGLTKALATPNAKVADLLAELHVTPDYVGESGKGKVPEPVSVSRDAAGALASLPTVLDGIRFPKHTDKLSRTQVEDFNTLFDVLGQVEDLAKAARASGRTALLNHRDRVAEEKGLVDADTPRDKEGHYLIKHPELDTIFHVREQPESLTVAVAEPKTAITAESLQAEVDEEAFVGDEQVALTHADFLAMTEPGDRVVSDRKLMRYLRRHPKLTPLVLRAAVRSGGSLSVRRAKNAS